MSKNYVFILLSATSFYIAVYMANTICGRYAISLGTSNTVAGFVTAAFTLASFIARPVWGWIVDKYSRRYVCLAGGVLSFVASVMLIFSKTIVALLISRIISGCGYSAFTTASGTVVCDVSPGEKLGQAISIYGITGVISGAVAPVAALWLFDRGWVWLIISVLSAIATIIIIMVNYNEKNFINSDCKFELYEHTALPAAYTIIFFAMSAAAINSFIPIMAKERQLTADGAFFVVSAVFMFFARLVINRINEKVSLKKTFYIADMIYIIAFILLSLTSGNLLLVVSSAFYGIGSGVIHPVVNTAAVQNCRSEKRGLATATFMMSQDLGMTIGAAVWGFISEQFGFNAVYVIVVILLLVMMYVFRILLAELLE